MLKTPHQVFIGQCSRENPIAVACVRLKLKKGRHAPSLEMLGDWREGGYQPMDVMERHLKKHASLTASYYSIDTIALYAFAPVDML